jgi:hypothetical protein
VTWRPRLALGLGTGWTGLSLPEATRNWRSGPNSGGASDNSGVDLGRLAWLATVIACLLTAAILLLQGYIGYALVTFAVAASAAINLR